MEDHEGSLDDQLTTQHTLTQHRTPSNWNSFSILKTFSYTYTRFPQWHVYMSRRWDAVSSAELRCVVNAYHDGEDQGHDVDGVCRTKAGENCQTKVAAEWRRRFTLLYRTSVKICAPAQRTLHLWIKDSKSHFSRFLPHWNTVGRWRTTPGFKKSGASRKSCNYAEPERVENPTGGVSTFN